jgi:hypothetical protein
MGSEIGGKKVRKVLIVAVAFTMTSLVAAPALAQGGSASGGGSTSGGGGSASQAPAPVSADETPAVDTPAEEAAEEAAEGTPGAADETPAVDTSAEEVAEEVGEQQASASAAGQSKDSEKKSGNLPASGGISPVVLIAGALLVSGAVIGVVALRRRS